MTDRFEHMQAHVDEGGTLSHGNGVECLRMLQRHSWLYHELAMRLTLMGKADMVRELEKEAEERFPNV